MTAIVINLIFLFHSKSSSFLAPIVKEFVTKRLKFYVFCEHERERERKRERERERERLYKIYIHFQVLSSYTLYEMIA
jgi:hypothetical protein